MILKKYFLNLKLKASPTNPTILQLDLICKFGLKSLVAARESEFWVLANVVKFIIALTWQPPGLWWVSPSIENSCYISILPYICTRIFVKKSMFEKFFFNDWILKTIYKRILNQPCPSLQKTTLRPSSSSGNLRFDAYKFSTFRNLGNFRKLLTSLASTFSSAS